MKKERPIIFVDGNITVSELLKIIPDDFDGDIIITKDLYGEYQECYDSFEELLLNLNGGDLYVLRDMYNIKIVKLNGNLFCHGNLYVKHLMINGNLFVGDNFAVLNTASICGNVTVLSSTCVYASSELSILGDFESKTYVNHYTKTIVEVKGNTNFTNGFSVLNV